MSINPVVQSVCARADGILWDAYAAGAPVKSAALRMGRLVFPMIRGGQPGDMRVSEQEARFAVLESLCHAGLNYAVEAPTSESYQFTGDVGQSAQTDLTVYSADGVERLCNIEFKAKGISTTAENKYHIYKDFEKLLREPTPGVWYHLLESTNNSTIEELIAVMNDQIDEVYKKFPQQVHLLGLSVHVCVLRHGFSLHVDMDTKVKPVLPQVRLEVTRDALKHVTDLNGWTLTRRA